MRDVADNGATAKAARSFWESDEAGDTFNYPWEACALFADQQREAILDLITALRDQHAIQAADWQRSMERYTQTGSDNVAVSECSGMIERNNFAVQTLTQLLRKVETHFASPSST